jgi:hypothetical protein
LSTGETEVNAPLFEIVKEEMPQEFGSSPRLFSVELFENFMDDIQEQWGCREYPGTDLLNLQELINWLVGMGEQERESVLRDAALTEADETSIYAALEDMG